MTKTMNNGQDDYSQYKEPEINDRGLPIRVNDWSNISYIYLLIHDVMYFLYHANMPSGIHMNRLKDAALKTMNMLKDGGFMKRRGDIYSTTAVGTKLLFMMKTEGLRDSIRSFIQSPPNSFMSRYTKIDRLTGLVKYVDGFTVSEAIASILSLSEQHDVRREYTGTKGASYGIYSVLNDVISDANNIDIAPDLMDDILSMMRGIRKKDVSIVVPCIDRLSRLGYSIVQIQDMFHIDDDESMGVLTSAYNIVFSS